VTEVPFLHPAPPTPPTTLAGRVAVLQSCHSRLAVTFDGSIASTLVPAADLAELRGLMAMATHDMK
jgi:hypothetical protein